MMKKAYNIHQICIAYVLLVSLFLQSCYNQSVPFQPSDSPSSLSNHSRQSLTSNLSHTSWEQDTHFISTNDGMALGGNDSPNTAKPTSYYQRESALKLPTLSDPSVNTASSLTNRPGYVHKNTSKQGLKLPQQTTRLSYTSLPTLTTKQHISSLTKRATEQDEKATNAVEILLKNPVYFTRDGYQVEFLKLASGELQAILKHDYFKGVATQKLPVVIGLDAHCPATAIKNAVWQRKHIHVVKDHVYVGGMGLKGGGKKQQEGEKQAAEKPASPNNSEDLLQKLSNVHNDTTIQETKSSTWATGVKIYEFLTGLFDDSVHVIHPDLTSIHSPADDSDQDNAAQGAINYAKEIKEIIKNSPNKKLNKPIIMILNTTPAGPGQKSDAQRTGGSHWQTCIILPKHYSGPFVTTKLDNEHEVLFYIDSINPNKKAPVSLSGILKQGADYIIEADEVIDSTGKKEKVKKIDPIFPNLEVRDELAVKQQVGDGSSCGWWAVYNALMIVRTGGTGHLGVFKQLSKEQKQIMANKLRTLMPDLDGVGGVNSKKDIQGGKKEEKKPPQTYKVLKYTIGTNHQPSDSRLIAKPDTDRLQQTPDGLKHALHGDLYQLGLLTLVAIRAHNDKKSFHLVSEAKECEKFDDLVIDYGNRITFLQAKHSSKDPKEDGYSATDFRAKQDGEASLAKYFDSWFRLKRSEYVKNQDGSEKASRFIFFTNRHIKKDERNYLEPAKRDKADEFFFKGLKTTDLKFKDGKTRSEFMDAIRAHSEEVKKHKADNAKIDLKQLDKELQEATTYLEKKFQEFQKTAKKENKPQQKQEKKELKVDGRSQLSDRAIALIGLVKTDNDIKNEVLARIDEKTKKSFTGWLESVKIDTGIQNPNQVLASVMEEEIKQFLDELIIKIEQPGINELSQLLEKEFHLNNNIGGRELLNVLHNRMLQWLSDRQTCLLKSDEFGEWMKVEKGDLQRFYLLGSTKMFEEEFENYPIDLQGLEIKDLLGFLVGDNGSTLAVINDTGSKGIKARVYQTVRTFCKEKGVQDAEWAFIYADSKYFKELPSVLKGPSTQFVIVDCRNMAAFPDDSDKVLSAAAKNNKKLVLLMNDLQKKKLSTVLPEKYCEIDMPPLTDEQVAKVCGNKEYAAKSMNIGGKYFPLSSIVKHKHSGIYRQLKNLDSLPLMLKFLVEAPKEKNVDSGLPYDVYVENDLIKGIPCYDLLTILQVANAKLFVIEGVEKSKIDQWLTKELNKEEHDKRYVSGKIKGNKDTKYRLVNELDKNYEEKLIYVSDSSNIPQHKYDSYVHLKLVGKKSGEDNMTQGQDKENPKTSLTPSGYEVTIQDKSDQIILPAHFRPLFNELQEKDQERTITHIGVEFLIEQKPAFSILTAHAGYGKSAFCLSQCAKWRNAKPEQAKLPLWVIRINLPQLKLPTKSQDAFTFEDVFTLSSTGEKWPAWKVAALRHDMKKVGRVFLLLDGFDEIKNENTVQALNEWIRGLHKNTSVLVTTRPYAAHKIVPNSAHGELRCMTLKEYNDQQHKNYIHEYLKSLFKAMLVENKLSEPSKEALQNLSDKVYEQLNSLVSKATTRLLGIPLETYLFCEALRPYIQQHYLSKSRAENDTSESLSPMFTNALSQELQDLVISPSADMDVDTELTDSLDTKSIFDNMRINTISLYQRFMQSKLHMFLQKHMQMDATTTLRPIDRIFELTTIYTEILMAFAFKQAFNLPYTSLGTMLSVFQYNAKMIDELADTGLVTVVKRDKEYMLKFSHETYQEYLTALYLLKGLASGRGDAYNTARDKIRDCRYIPKYRMIMIMAAQLSLTGNPIIPAWNRLDEEQLREFWKILTTPGDVLGAASSKLLKDCLRDLLPEQMEKLKDILQDCDWESQVVDYIENIEKWRHNNNDLEKKMAQGIDTPFDAASTILQGGQKMDEKRKEELKVLLKDKSKVVAVTKEVLATISPSDVAQVFDEIIDDEPIPYWDIDGGFQAMALLGNSFNKQHAKYFVKRIKTDSSWRTNPAFQAIHSLLAQNPEGEAKAACAEVMVCLAEHYEDISSDQEGMLQSFFSPAVDALIAKLRKELSLKSISKRIQASSLSKGIFGFPIRDLVRMLLFAYQAGCAVVPIMHGNKISFIGDIVREFSFKDSPLANIFQDIIKCLLNILPEISRVQLSTGLIGLKEVIEAWLTYELGYDPYLKKRYQDQLIKKWEKESLKMLERVDRWIDESENDSNYDQNILAAFVSNEEVLKELLEHTPNTWNLFELYENFAKEEDQEKFFTRIAHDEKVFSKMFGSVKGNATATDLCSLYEQLEKYNLITKDHVDMLVRELQRDKPAWDKDSNWSRYGGIEATKFCWKYFNKGIADYLAFRYTCWPDNKQKVENVLNYVRRQLFENPNNDQTYKTAISAYNDVAQKVSGNPHSWLGRRKFELLYSPQTQLAFWKAIKCNNVAEVKELLTNGVDVNFKNLSKGERSPLHIAAQQGNIGIAEVLLSSPDIEINLQDTKSKTALDIAEKYNHSELVDTLMQYGAKHGSEIDS